MLSLEKREGEDYIKGGFHLYRYNLLINGNIADKTIVSGSFSKNDPEKFDIDSQDSEISEKLLKYKWSEFPNLTNISLLLRPKNDGFVNRLLIEKDRESKELFVNLYFNPSLQTWKNVYSYQDFENSIIKWEEFLDTKQIEIKTWNDDEQLTVEFITTLILERSLFETLNPFIETCFSVFDKTVTQLTIKDEKRGVHLNFKFPETIKVSCEQYLLYFVNFLQDLGVNASSSIKEEAGNVLFSVTPNDNVEALDKIREALALYLNLPNSPIAYDDSFAAIRLQQQIENLQHAQKMAAREFQLTEKLLFAQSATIQEKNLIISQKDSVIDQQKAVIEKILSKSIMIDSAENKEELEEIYDGLKIGESKFLKEQLGIHLNPAKVIKTAVRNTFGKDDVKKSVLGLDED